VEQLVRLGGREQFLLPHGRQGGTPLDSRVQCQLLGGAAHLPRAQREGGCDTCRGGCAEEPEPAPPGFAAHGIIARMKYLVLLAFAAIIGSLGSALFFMMRDGRDGKPKTSNMARALAFRVGFSILLFVCILLAWKFGYIQPTGIPLAK
jgi:hypothetical protein